MRIGIDVGGTNTDSVLIDGTQIVRKSKTTTTENITNGVKDSLRAILPSGDNNLDVNAVMIGTTHFTNALLQKNRLATTAALRLCLPATQMLPPMVDWPKEMKESIKGYTYLVDGWVEFDGREISPIDKDQIRKAADDMANRGVEAIAISGIFSSVDPSQEQIAAQIVQEETPHIKISMSHEIGRVGVLERENATILNACLSTTSDSVVRAFREAVE